MLAREILEIDLMLWKGLRICWGDPVGFFRRVVCIVRSAEYKLVGIQFNLQVQVVRIRVSLRIQVDWEAKGIRYNPWFGNDPWA